MRPRSIYFIFIFFLICSVTSAAIRDFKMKFCCHAKTSSLLKINLCNVMYNSLPHKVLKEKSKYNIIRTSNSSSTRT